MNDITVNCLKLSPPCRSSMALPMTVQGATLPRVNFLRSKGGHYFRFCKTHKCVRHKKATDCKNLIERENGVNVKLQAHLILVLHFIALHR